MNSMAMARNSGRLKLGGSRSNRAKKERKPLSLAGPLQALGRMCKTVFCLAAGLALLGSLSFGLLYGYRWMTANPFFTIREINVSGISRLSYGDVLATCDVSVGSNALDVSVAKLERQLAQNPWVAAASVRRDLPDKLFITITERQPAYWVEHEGRMHYADSGGVIITPVDPALIVSLPVLEVSAHAEGFTDSLTRLCELLQNPDLPFSQGQIASVKLAGPSDVEIFLDAEQLMLRFSMGNWRVGLHRIVTVWDDLKARGEIAQVQAISVAGDKIWVEKKNAARL